MAANVETIELIYRTISAELAQRCETEGALALASDQLPDDTIRDSRRRLVDILCREGQLPRVSPSVGKTLASLAGQGVFRKGAVLLNGPMLEVYAACLGVTVPINRFQIGTHRRIDVCIPGDLHSVVQLDRQAQSGVELLDEEANSLEVVDGRILRSPMPLMDRGAAPPFSTADPRVLKYLLRSSVQSVLLHDDGCIVRLPAPEHLLVASILIWKETPPSVPLDWLVEAIIKQRMQAEVAIAIEDAICQQRIWRKIFTQNVALLPGRLCESFNEIWRIGATAIGARTYNSDG